MHNPELLNNFVNTEKMQYTFEVRILHSSIQVHKYKHHGAIQLSYGSKVQINPRTAKDLVKMLEETGRQVSVTTYISITQKAAQQLIVRSLWKASQNILPKLNNLKAMLTNSSKVHINT